MSATLIWIIAVGLPIVLVALVVGVPVALYNGLVRARAMVAEGWSGIDVQLRRRADLIPALVETVRLHAGHERELFALVTARREAALGAAHRPARNAAEGALTTALSQLVSVAGGYPQLTTDASFVGLQTQLAAVEADLQDARRYYNATARELNLRLHSVPAVLFAGALGFEDAPYFEAGNDAALLRPPAIGLLPASPS